ncbi:MAG TPA: DUF362 domain-containing protein, partial [Clostridia bacterium]|nr:DUF362 domain-containing protein [Clostridia bacterium]
MEKVSVIGCREYDPDRLVRIIEEHFCALDPENKLIRKGSRVVVKPNLIMRRKPEEATTTHPDFVAAVIRAVKKRGGEAVIADSPGGPYTKSQLRSIYAGTGMTQAAEREGAELNDDVGFTAMMSKDGKVCRAFNIINPLAQADVIISVAKLKTHGQMNFSGAVKNMFGAIPGLTKPEFHYRYPNKNTFGEMLVDLCETVRPAISLIDGVIGMEGNGPTGGSPKFMGVTMASLNPYAMDLIACSVIGMPASMVPTVAASQKRGLCPDHADEIEILGEDFNHFASDFQKPESMSLDFIHKMPGFIRKPLTRVFTPKPVIKKATCIGCGKCAESCPQKTISIIERKAVIDYTECIK